MSDSIRDERAASNEDLFRRMNERLHALATLTDSPEPYERFVCECTDPGCAVVIELMPDEYRTVRGDGARFVVHPAASHTDTSVEAVVRRFDRYWVVEKTGRAGQEAERLADDDAPLL